MGHTDNNYDFLITLFCYFPDYIPLNIYLQIVIQVFLYDNEHKHMEM